MRGMNSWVVLVATIALAAYCHAQENAAGEVLGEADAIASKGDRSASSEEKIDAQEDYGLHVVNPGRLESYKYFEQMILVPSAKDCEEWSPGDSRIGMLFSISGTSRLFIGKRRDTDQRVPDAHVDQIEKNYDVTRLTLGGSPIEGNVIVTLPASDMEEERVCLENLRGVPIQWVPPRGESSYVEGAVELTVQDVQFFREARMEGSGEIAPTGEFLASLKMSETWISMAFREMKAHIWGIAGSALLMMLAATSRWLIRGVRKVIGGASINLTTLSRIQTTRNIPPNSTAKRESAPDVDEPVQTPKEAAIANTRKHHDDTSPVGVVASAPAPSVEREREHSQPR